MNFLSPPGIGHYPAPWDYFRAYRVVPLFVPIAAPLPNVAGHIVKAQFVRRHFANYMGAIATVKTAHQATLSNLLLPANINPWLFFLLWLQIPIPLR